ncbi:MAG: SSS family solute:Na+ symporter [Salibacteraceae bacterium]|jgi:SSS family transporter
MVVLDWIILIGTLLFIVLYGAWKTRKNNSIASYLKGDNEMGAWTIGLSVMATQASAITFLSTPGQAYENGMGFIQFYFGLPLALIVVSAVFIPIYYKLNVYTAYEYLEGRFGVHTRLFTAFLFLVSRGLAAGITIYAPSIVLSSLLGWDLDWTNIFVGILVIIYTVSGGTKAVSLTQKWQMGIIMFGMFTAFFLIIQYLSEDVTFAQAVDLGGVLGKMEIINTDFDLSNRYTIWTGLLGGFFLSLSYFGTDQSQVQRYLGGKNIKESRMGMMFNAVLKIPMQFFILFVGLMVFVFYQFNEPPAFFNAPGKERIYQTEQGVAFQELESQYSVVFSEKKKAIQNYLSTDDVAQKEVYRKQSVELYQQSQDLRGDIRDVVTKADIRVDGKDTDYVFLTFILKYLPHGVIGLLLAVILSAAMSSTASELNALASTTMVDYYQRLFKKDGSDQHYVSASKWLTVIWGVMAIGIALSAHLFENLIQLVNILGSLFYGTILGIFLVAFFFKRIQQKALLIGAVTGQVLVLTLHLMTVYAIIDLGYLWYNVIGSTVVIVVALVSQLFIGRSNKVTA